MPQSTISKESAIEANQQFDRTVKNFLRGWLLLGSPDDPSSPDDLTSINAFVDGGALREFFKRQEEPLQQLLANPGIATHLCRTHRDVYFDPATNER